MTDSTLTPHDAEYREQRKFEALVTTHPTQRLRDMTQEAELEEWQLVMVSAELDRRSKP